MYWRLILSGTLLAAIATQGQTTPQLKVVKNAPFSADVVTLSTQELPDGNRIARQTTAQIARDRDGRTSREQAGSNGSSSATFLQDPSAGTSYVLDKQTHVARKVSVATLQSEAAPGNGRADANIKSESLGFQVLEGFVVPGVRLTRIIAAGQDGNDQPIKVVSEAWYSDELQTLLLSKTVDPRFGETTYRLTKIDRTEPSHELFEVPKDYVIRDEPTLP